MQIIAAELWTEPRESRAYDLENIEYIEQEIRIGQREQIRDTSG